MTPEYLAGALARAQKLPYDHSKTEAWKNGYHEMETHLSPIETEILVATIRYRAVAEAVYRKMEGGSSDPGDARDAATPAAECALPSERPAEDRAPPGNTDV